MYSNKFFVVAFAITAGTIFTSCNKKEGCMDPAAINFDQEAETDCCCEYPDEFNLSFHLHSYVGASELTEGNTYVINGFNTKLDIVRFYISNIRMVDASGAETPATGKYLLVTPSEESYNTGSLPPGEYTKLRFDVGIDSVTNHADPSTYNLGNPLGPQFPNMHWGWDFGYIFLRIDGMVDKDLNGSTETPFEMHLGKDEFLTTIEIDYPFNTEAGNDYSAHITINWADLFDGVDMTGELTTHTTDNMSLATLIANNLQFIFSKEE